MVTSEEIGGVSLSPTSCDGIAQMHTTEEHFRSVCNSLGVGIFEVDIQGQCLYANTACQTILGLPMDQLSGDGWLRCIASEDRNGLIGRGLHEFNGQVTALRPDGERRQLWIRLYPKVQTNETFGAMVGTVADVTERRRTEKELHEAREAAELANRRKEEFVARVSHEIRTPMHGIIGMAELVLATQLSSDQRDYVETAKHSAENLLRVVNDLLDFARIESGQWEIESIPFDIKRTVQSTLQTLSLKINEKEIELTSAFSPGIPRLVQGDPARLRQILNNLLDNALKFTESGFIHLEVAVEAGTDTELTLRFTVRDTGSGIAVESIERIFQPVQQADNKSTRIHGGNGMGLAICSGLVDAMGGRMWVESAMGQGSAFYFTIQMGRCMEQPGARILLVEGQPIDRRVLARALSDAGFEVVATPTSQDALRCVAAVEIPFDLLIVNDSEPLINGLELIEQIQRLPATKLELPVLISCVKIPAKPEAYLQAGVKRWVRNPFSGVEIVLEAEALLGLQPGRQRSQPPQPVRSAITARVLVADDQLVDQRLAQRLLEAEGHQVTIAADGPKAYALLETEAFDLCFMDIQMPLVDGLEVTRQIRQLEARIQGRVRHTPIIAVTADAMPGTREICLEAGMDDYTSKPFKRDDFVALLNRWLPVERRPVPLG